MPESQPAIEVFRHHEGYYARFSDLGVLRAFEHHVPDFADALLSVHYQPEGSALVTFDAAASRLPHARRLGDGASAEDDENA